MLDLIRALADVFERRERAALATVVRVSGSAPQRPGARILLRSDGSIAGTVGGGSLEARVLEDLRGCLAGGASHLVTYDLVRDLGMCCGGTMEIFMESIESPARLFLFGAGHVARPTAALARSVGFSPIVVDEREAWNNEERFPGCERILRSADDAFDEIDARGEDWFVIMTHEHRLDEVVLERLLSLPHRYIGMMGSRRKVLQILQRIAARTELPSLERLYAPVGTPLGAVEPEEIAVSIVSELVALRRGAAVSHLSLVGQPALHAVLDGSASPTDAARAPAEGTRDEA